jgi:hypothetical protein
MLFGRNKEPRNMAPSPIVPSKNSYAQRAADSLSVYNADMEPPATSYATVDSKLSSRLVRPTVGPKTDAAYVVRKPRLNGLKFNWSWGGINMGKQTESLPGVDGGGLNGFVRRTNFQPVLVQLHDWQTNDNWYIAWNGTGAGMFNHQKAERYQYPSFRVSQVHTNTSGGVGTARMTKRPRYTSVQAIKKYTAQPSYYNTKGTKS